MVAQLGDVLVQLGYLRLVVLAAYGLALYLQLLQPAGYLIEFLRHRVALHAQFGGGLVHQVNGLVGQEAVADVAFRQLHSGYAGVVLYTHLVVVLIALLQTAQDADGTQLVGLVHHHRLETTLQRLVLLKVFLVFVERGGADGTELAAGQGRFQNVGGIHGALAGTGSHQRVYLIDEEDDAAVGLHHLIDDALEPLFKLAFVLGAGNELAHVERIDLLVAQVLGHVAAYDSLRQAFHDGGLAGARLADEHGVVLGSPR